MSWDFSIPKGKGRETGVFIYQLLFLLGFVMPKKCNSLAHQCDHGGREDFI